MTDEEKELKEREASDKRNRNISRTKAKQTAWKKKSFLDALRIHGTDNHACGAAGIEIHSVMRWKREDADFLSGYTEAQEYLTDVLKKSGFVRATEGIERPIYQGGKKVGAERVYSDRCWEILLKGRDKSFRGLDDASQSEISRAVDEIVSKVMLAVNKGLPQTCPHCKNLLGLRENVVKELEKVSGTMGTPTK